jgi:protoporphyrinogen IX oxidase
VPLWIWRDTDAEIQMLDQVYPWVKAIHIIAVIAWMAGVLYLPRLYVYHAGSEIGSPLSETFKTMERRLLYYIIHPAMLVTLLFGVVLMVTPGIVDWHKGWLHGKLLLVGCLFVYTIWLGLWRRRFAADRRDRTAGYFRVANEIPTILMIGIVILVVVKPF